MGVRGWKGPTWASYRVEKGVQLLSSSVIHEGCLFIGNPSMPVRPPWIYNRLPSHFLELCSLDLFSVTKAHSALGGTFPATTKAVFNTF